MWEALGVAAEHPTSSIVASSPGISLQSISRHRNTKACHELLQSGGCTSTLGGAMSPILRIIDRLAEALSQMKVRITILHLSARPEPDQNPAGC